jgi:parvulin-like peptidyl-prolyl isomerase
MKSLPVPRSRRMAAAATALLGLALAGCSHASPGVVAYVGDDAITQSAVDAAVAGVSSTLQQGQTVSAEAVVNAMIQGKLAEQIAAEKQIAITDAERDAALQGSNLEGLVAVPAAREVVYDLADQRIVSQKIGGDAYLKEIQRRSVTLNPRFGVLDPAQKTIVTGQSGSLSKPAAEPTP